MCSRRLANRFFGAVHKVRTATAMDMQVDKAWDD